ncbi:MAG: hypothetical protein RJA25_2225 [Bacteroidota bacterium]|jgi:acetyl esterase/lipase
MKKILLTYFSVLLFFSTSSATDCSNGRYFNPIFPKVKRTNNIKYGAKRQSDGAMFDLKYDVYEPLGDTVSERPVMLLIHGGAYLKLLDQNSPDIVLMSTYFAQRGYVAVSIDYRQEPNLLGLLSEEIMVKAVARALIDTKDAVDHIVNTYSNGNPYRIDTSKAFIGGVSAGAVSTLFIMYLDSLQQLPVKYQTWVKETIGPAADSILRTKFDHVKPKAGISVSGALLDTSWIVNNGMDLLLNHGSADDIVPYLYGHPFNIQTLPVLYGGKSLYPRAVNQGIHVEFEDWAGRGHVPFMNLTFPDMIFNLINQPILDSTERHIRDFCYRLLDCNSKTTGIRQNLMQEHLAVFPNPSNGNFNIELPKNIMTTKWELRMYDLMGKEVLSKEYAGNAGYISLNENLPMGNYFITMQYRKDAENFVYTGKLVITQ